jgi:hypothetical protein
MVPKKQKHELAVQGSGGNSFKSPTACASKRQLNTFKMYVSQITGEIEKLVFDQMARNFVTNYVSEIAGILCVFQDF